MNDPAPLRVLAYHEAGHAVCAFLLRGPGAVMYARIHQGGGVVGLHSNPIFLRDHDSNVIGSDPGLRAAVEKTLVGILAGAEAGKLATLPSGYDEPTERDRQAVQLAASLPPRDLELVADADPYDIPVREGDDAEIAALAGRFAGEEWVAYVEWLRVIARNFVIRHWGAVERVAAALLEHSVIPGFELAAIIEGPTPSQSALHERNPK
jgi:hypothetical protein